MQAQSTEVSSRSWLDNNDPHVPKLVDGIFGFDDDNDDSVVQKDKKNVHFSGSTIQYYYWYLHEPDIH